MKNILISFLLLVSITISGQKSAIIASSSSTSSQNLALYSEQLDNGAAWYSSNMTVLADQTQDLTGGTTMEKITVGAVGGATSQGFVAVSPSTSYVFSFDVKRGTQGSHCYYQIIDETHDADIVSNTDYYSSTSSSVQRVSFSFTTPSGCTAITIYPLGYGDTIGDNFYIGRVQVALSGRSYVTTTSTSVP